MFYDAECRFCVAGMKRWGGLFARRGFQWLPLQTPGTAARLGVSEGRLMEEMWVQLADGRVVSGVNSWAQLMRSVWWMWPFGILLGVPGINAMARVVYRWIARNRHCFGGSCKIHTHKPAAVRVSDVIVLGLMIVAVVYVGRVWPAWIFMWAMAFALYTGCKWLTYREAMSNGASPPPLRAAGYLIAWVGMDAKTFLDAKPVVNRPHWGEWLFAAAKTFLGFVIFSIASLAWFWAWNVPQTNDLLVGWMCMVGVILLLHFGSFHLLALAWRAAGVNAAPLMRSPLRSVSLAEFWGKRWNTAFHELVHRFTFRPLTRRVGAMGAMLLVFLLSGLVHELVISLPARGGYGLPTGYFLLQGLGVACEHTRVGRRIGLGHGWRGWLFTMFVTIAPAFWLFHPPFIRHVILPMLKAFNAN